MKLGAVVPGILVIAAAILATPFVTAPGYSVVRHSISELGAQGAPNAWIMNVGFAAFGAGVLTDAVRRIRNAQVVGWSFVVFGASLFGVAAFSHSPIDPAAAFSAEEDRIHSVFATIMGIAFSIGAIAQSFHERDMTRRLMCFGAVAAGSGLPLLMLAMPDVAGLLQRLMFLVSFMWLAMFLPPEKATPP
ncbi:DUF998 domain-containing protein [bacterium]|nr:DUF998 domain-containing protein [bacterium]